MFTDEHGIGVANSEVGEGDARRAVAAKISPQVSHPEVATVLDVVFEGRLSSLRPCVTLRSRFASAVEADTTKRSR